MPTKLTSAAEITKAKATFDGVFRSADPFDEPFRPQVEQKLILFPVDYMLEDHRLAAIVGAAASVGEAEAFLSLIEGYKGSGFEGRDHWLVDLGPGMYESLRDQAWFPLMENALYSAKGTWGILFSHEQHAVLGGSLDFVAAVAARLPTAEADIREFLQVWKDNRDRLKSRVDWLPSFLEYLCGRDRASELLAEVGW